MNNWNWACEIWCANRLCAGPKILHYILFPSQQGKTWGWCRCLILYATNIAGSSISIICEALRLLNSVHRFVKSVCNDWEHLEFKNAFSNYMYPGTYYTFQSCCIRNNHKNLFFTKDVVAFLASVTVYCSQNFKDVKV